MIYPLVGRLETRDFRTQAWNDVSGYPRAVTFHQSRLVFAGSVGRPDGIWFSQLGNLYRFKADRLLQDVTSDVTGLDNQGPQEVQADDPFELSASASSVEPIQWIKSGDVLQVGTLNSEIIIRGSDDDSALSALSNDTRVQTYEGSSLVDPVQFGRATLFVSKDGRGLNEFAVSPRTRRHEVVDLNTLNPTIFDHHRDIRSDPHSRDSNFVVNRLAYSNTLDIVFVKTKIEGLLSLSLHEDGSSSWARHTLGGRGNPSGSLPPMVKDICVLPSSDGEFDELWLLVERFIVGNETLTTLEKMGDVYRGENKVEFEDRSNSMIYYDLSRLYRGFDIVYDIFNEGEVLSAFADGSKIPDVTVERGGRIPLTSFREVFLGYDNKVIIDPVPLQVGAKRGDASGSFKRITDISLHLYRSYGGDIKAKSVDEVNPIRYENYDNIKSPGGRVGLFTGHKKVQISSGYDIDAGVRITTSGPYPFNLLSITYDGITYE